MAGRIPDLVKDSELKTIACNGEYTEHERRFSGNSPGQRVAKVRERWYRRQEALGSGGFGMVWLESRKLDNKEKVYRAVKEIKMEGTSVRSVTCIKELEAIAKFSHEKYRHCFVRSYGWFEWEMSLYISMEYLRSGDMFKYLQKHSNKLSEPEVKEILGQVLEGLSIMHEEGFSHRDLKPANILIMSCPPNNWWVKIADFGLSKRTGDRPANADSTGGFGAGTPGFMAPELVFRSLAQVSHRDGKAADMWAIGEIGFQMLAGRPTFLRKTELEAFVRGAGQFPRWALEKAGASQLATDFIRSNMQPKPDDRWPVFVARDHMWFKGKGPLRQEPTPIRFFRASTEPIERGGRLQQHGRGKTPLEEWSHRQDAPRHQLPANYQGVIAGIPGLAKIDEIPSLFMNQSSTSYLPGAPSRRSNQIPAIGQETALEPKPLSLMGKLKSPVYRKVTPPLQGGGTAGELKLESWTILDTVTRREHRSDGFNETNKSPTAHRATWIRAGRERDASSSNSGSSRLSYVEPRPLSPNGLKRRASNISFSSYTAPSNPFGGTDVTLWGRIMFSNEGKYLLSITEKKLKIWETNGGKFSGDIELKEAKPSTAIILPLAGNQLVVGCVDNQTIDFWDMNTKKCLHSVVCKPPHRLSSGFVPIRQRLAVDSTQTKLAVLHFWRKATAFEEEIKIYLTTFDALTHKCIGDLSIPATIIPSIMYQAEAGEGNVKAPDPLHLSTTESPDFHFHVRFTPAGEVIVVLKNEVFLCNMLARGRKTISKLASEANLLTVAQQTTDGLVFTSVFGGHKFQRSDFDDGTGTGQAVAKPAGPRSNRRVLQVWSLSRPGVLLALEHPKNVLTFAVSPDGKLLIVALDSAMLLIWDLVADPPHPVLRAGPPVVATHYPPSWSPDGRWFVTYHEDECRLWRTPIEYIERVRKINVKENIKYWKEGLAYVGEAVKGLNAGSLGPGVLPDTWPGLEEATCY